jgi:hypothetical protein
MPVSLFPPYILSGVLVTKDVGLSVSQFIGYSLVLTTTNYYTIADLPKLQSLHTNFISPFPLVFTIRFLATVL